MSETKLLCCPCCAGNSEIKIDKNSGLFYSKCNKCGLTGRGFVYKEGAVKHWNTRKPMERIVERLEDKAYESECPPFPMAIDLKDAIEIVKEEGGIND